MDQVTKRRANGTRLAVSRDYQPARIERELLAQIFDLVERGVRKDSEPYDAPQEQVVIAARFRLENTIAASMTGGRNALCVTELEDVA
jgi:hypothetical protein